MKTYTETRALSAVLIAAQSADREAQACLATLLITTLKPLIARALRVVADADREDALQETFLRLIQPPVPFDPAHPQANAISHCFNAARSAANWRGRMRENSRAGTVDPDDLQSPSSSQTEARNDLRAAQAIDPTLFEVVAAVECGGVTAKVAGSRFGMTASKVCRARQRYSARCREALLAA